MPHMVIIKGGAYGAFTSRGNKVGVKEWQMIVKQATERTPKIKGPCKLQLRFVLPPNRYPTDHPYGPDVDNLASAVMDALNETIFSDVPGKDGAVLWLETLKLKAEKEEDAQLIIFVEALPKKVVTLKGSDDYYLGPLMKAQRNKRR